MPEKYRNADEFVRRVNNSLAIAKLQKRGASKALATALWVQANKDLHGCRSAYALEKLFEPEAFNRNDQGEIYHSNKWAKYEVGLRTPRKELVQRVERQTPGSSSLLYHPLWEILRCRARTKELESWLSRLSPDTRLALVDRASPAINGFNVCKKLDGRKINMIERRSGLDALAVFTLFFFIAIEDGNYDDALLLADSLFRTLLIVCGFTPFHKFSNSLLDLFNSQVFSLLSAGGVSFDFSEYDFSELTLFLTKVLVSIKGIDSARKMSDKNVINFKLAMINGDYGYDIACAMQPPIKLSGTVRFSSDETYKKHLKENRLQAWGLSVLRSGRVEKFPPDHLW